MDNLKETLSRRPLSLPLVLVAGVLALAAALTASVGLASASYSLLGTSLIMAIFFEL